MCRLTMRTHTKIRYKTIAINFLSLAIRPSIFVNMNTIFQTFIS